MKVAGVNAALVTCKNLPGQFNDPNSNAGRDAEYLKTQGVKCPKTGDCVEYCSIDLTSNLGPGLSDLLGGLKSACENDGGTYREKLF